MNLETNTSHHGSYPTVRGELFSAPLVPGLSHKVSAIYATSGEAESVRQRLIDCGVGAGDVVVLHDLPLSSLENDDDEVLKEILVDGAIGTAVGTGVGAFGTAIIGQPA